MKTIITSNSRSLCRALCTVLLGIAALWAMPRSGKAVPIQFGSEYFDFVSDVGVPWATAETDAAGSTFMGINGYLAVITSAAENNFLSSNFATFSGFAGAWLGGEVFGSGSGGTGIWEVGPLAGEVFSYGQTPAPGAYANWGGIEPNNAPSAAYMNIGTLYAGISTGQWADAANGLSSPGDPIQGYLVEYSVAVPEASTWSMIGVGGMALLGIMLRKRHRTV